jgi:hypothetical protein
MWGWEPAQRKQIKKKNSKMLKVYVLVHGENYNKATVPTIKRLNNSIH